MVAHPSTGRAAGSDALEADLRRRLRGEVCFDRTSRALYATDASNYRAPPIGVVRPRDADDVAAAVAVCREHGAPIVSRGGGTSLAGQACNRAVVIDFAQHLNRVIDVDPVGRRARVEPGVILDTVRADVRPFGLTFGPDPATHDHCTLGGMLGNNSCGVHAVQAEFYGPGPRTGDNIHELEILTYDGLRLRVGATSEGELAAIIAAGGRRGDIYRRLRDLRDRHADAIRREFPDIPRRVSGYDLTHLLPEHGFHVARLLVGSECTLALILEAELELIPVLPERVMVLLTYEDVYRAGDDVPIVREFRPVGCEGMDDHLIDHMNKRHMHQEAVRELPEGGGWLLVEFGADDRGAAEEQARDFAAAMERRGGQRRCDVIVDRDLQQKIWEVREAGLGATAFAPGERDTWEGWEDSAVPPEAVGVYLRELRALFDQYGLGCALYGHFLQGCIHTRIDFELHTPEGVEHFRRFTEDAADLVLRHGGSISGEHGDGQARGDLLHKMFSPEIMDAFRELKAIWDPEGRMNPGKVIDARPRTADLRLRQYQPAPVKTRFSFPEDGGDFRHAALRCVGVGACRREGGGTMCPSYMVTREEKHTTRGRAHLLFEMLQGDIVQGGWKSEEVKSALDLCLSCKGCKGDCPVAVDMATYKAEFLYHYYQGRLRPRHAYAFGWIHRWARLGGMVPGLANLVMQTPGLSRLAKLAAGIAPERDLPRFAREPFRDSFRRRRQNGGGEPVILWADTFNDYFYPEVLHAAADVLEDAGYHVLVPRAHLCCGRALYDYGMLDTADALWRKTLRTLREPVEAGVPVVGLEPSCVAAFRDELPNLFPRDDLAKRLSESTHTLAELLVGGDYQPPAIAAHALLHGHCQQKAIMGMKAEVELLARMGVEIDMPDTGCCGLAGSFGYEREHYELSMAAGERVLLPAVRAAGDDALVVTDGFSCRQQIHHGTGRQPQHVAEVVAGALEGRPSREAISPDGARLPERLSRTDEVVVVTGATAGVGRATVREFARRGARIALLARGEDGLRATAEEVEELGGRALAISCDVADAEEVEAAADRVEAELGPIDVWVNNAMATVFSRVDDIDAEEFRRVTDVTYHGFVWGTMAALRRMRPRNRGTIVQVGSALAYRGIPLQAPYCGAKHAIRGFTDSLRTELLHDGVDVHLTMVHLPGLNTPQFRWGLSHMPREAQPVPPIYQPEVAARAIYRAAHGKRREVYVTGTTWKVILGQKLAPGVADHYLARSAVDGQQTDELRDPQRPSNLFSPVPGDHGAHGVFDDRARDAGPVQTLVTRAGATGLRVGAMAAGVALVSLATALLVRRRSIS